MTSQLVRYSLCPFSKWWTAFSLWKKLLALLLDIYIRLLGLSSFLSALKNIFWKLGVTHILKKILHLIMTMHGNWTWKYIISGSLPSRNAKIFLFLSLWFSDCHFHSVRSQDENSLVESLGIDHSHVSADAPFYRLALTFPTVSWAVLCWFTEFGTSLQWQQYSNNDI